MFSHATVVMKYGVQAVIYGFELLQISVEEFEIIITELNEQLQFNDNLNISLEICQIKIIIRMCDGPRTVKSVNGQV